MDLKEIKNLRFREQFIFSLNEFHTDAKTREGQIKKIMNYISNYIEHLKADIGFALSAKDSRIDITVSYVKEGQFAEIKIQDYHLRFIRDKTKILVVTNDFMCDWLDNCELRDIVIDTLKIFPKDIDELMDNYLRIAFTEKCISEMQFAELY